MKKRVLSMLLSFILCFSTLPMTAFAQETDAVVEQEEQQGADSAEEQEKQQEADSAEGQEKQQEADSAEGQEKQQEAAPVTEQKEAEAAAAPGEETSSDKSTTAGEAPDTVESAVESVSDSDAGTQDTGADDEKKAAVQKVQALINALPETVTEDNAESVSAQLEAIDEAMAELTEEQREELNMTRLHAISEALNTPMTVTEGQHIHPVCGAICTGENKHNNVTWTATSTLNSDMDAGNYYLTADVTLDNTWRPKSGTALDLNGHSITVDADVDAITVPVSCSFTLTDCNSSDGVHYFTKNTGKDNLWEPVGTGGDTTVTGGVITHSSGKNGSGIFMGGNGTFTMYGGTICGNYNDTAAGAGVRATQSKIIMPGGAISGNVAANHKSGGGVNLNGVGSSFDMSGNAQITDNTTNGFGGGVHMECTGGKVSFTMSDNAQITGNMCTGSACGGAGLYASGGEFTMNDNAAISDNRSLSERGYGGGVLVSANATFTVNGKATISRNSAYIESTSSWKNNYGGGVLVLGGTFNMNGGSISDNMAENGAGVYVKDNSSNAGTFTMNGGTITNNKVIKGNGGGVYVLSGFEIANDAQVLNNSRQDTSGQVTPDNVYLTTGKTFQINGKLTGGVHSIGVSAVDTPAEGSPVTIATAATGYTLTEEDADCFTSDADDIYPIFADGKVQMSKTAPHRHYLCGEEHHDVGDHTTDSQMTFTKLWMDDDGKLKIGDMELTATVTQDKGYFDQGQNVTCYELPAGNYYLGSSITLDYPIYIASHWGTAPKDVKLCLNGKTIKANGNFSAIVCSSVVSKTTFTLTDCQQTAGTIIHAANKTGSGVLLYSNGNGTRFNMYGGSLTHNTAELGGGVNIVANGDGGIFNLYGGVISGNKANGAGGGVYIDGRNAAFTMYGGEITNNTAGTDGGGVSAASAKTVMNGGSITGNTAAKGGGASVCHSSAYFYLNGGEIKNNKASENGGGVYMGDRLRSYTFTLNGTPDISGNTKDDVANNVYLSSGAVITVDNLDTNVQIPVTLEKMPTEGFYVKFAKAGAGFELDDKIARQFSIENDGSDKCDKRIIENDPDELWLYVTGDKLHEHAICGESCDHKPNHSKVLWTPLTYDTNTQQLMYGSLPVPSAVKETSTADDQGNPTKAYYTTYKLPAGNYYLAETIEMKGGSVTYNGNTVTSKGGVLEIETDVNLCLNGKWLVTSAPYVGVIAIEEAGALTLSDCTGHGEIRSYCNADAGVRIAGDTSQPGKFTMYDGAIMYTATGVLMGNNSIFNMYGGTISENATGVYMNESSIFNMYDGAITRNKMGVSVPQKSKFTIGGSADITDNGNKNVFLNDKAWITIDSSLKNSASIGVTTEKDPTDENPIQIATRATGWVLYTEIFKPDGTDQGYVVTVDEQNGKLYLNSHIHNWLYGRSADGQTITANCDVTGCPKSDGGWVTIDKPEHEVYGDGKSAEATLKAFNWQADAVTVSNIKYEQSGKTLSGAPTDAGTYWASITIGYATAGVQYTINSKKVTDPTIEVADAGTYDGTEKKPSVVVKDGEKVIPDSEYSVSYADNSNAGTATVTITDVAGGNYDVSGSQTFEIDQATITVTPKAGQEKTYGNGDPTLKYNVSGAENNETPAFSGALSRTDGTDVGEYKIIQGTLKLMDGDGFTATNYRLEFSNGVKFNIIPRPVTITGVSAQNKIYDGSADTKITGTAVINGLAAGDKEDVKVNDTMACATFENANAGAAKTVNFSGYALTGAKARNYTLSAQPGGVTADINPKELTITDVMVADKIYDGTTEAVITGVSFNGVVSGDSLTKDTDYTVTGTFATPAAGTGKNVTVTVKLADSVKNYILRNTEYTKNGCKISKAVLTAPADRDFTICNGARTTYTVMLSALLPSLESPREYGKLTYDDPQLTITDSSYEGTATVRRSEYEYGKLALTINATGKTEDYIGTITVKVHTDNYEDITLSFKIKATAKTVPQLDGPLTIDPAEITYGKKLGDIKISGTMKDGTEVVRGRFTWVTPDQVLPAGDQRVMWKFMPDVNVQYAEVTGYTTIKVHKVILTGAPDYVVITESGKKLSDAVLTVDAKWPAGTLEWIDDAGNVLPSNTVVKVNKTYKWRFTPADTNYETLTGSIELYHVDAPAVTVQPKSVFVTVGDKATFEVAATGTDVTYQWQIDKNNGNGFVDINGATDATYTTGVTDRGYDGFKYQCVLRNAAGFVITDTVVLTVQYQIIEGANGSWNQNTDGGSLRIRGNGEFSKFQNVKVDGNIIDSKNYTASKGSTIIELHADYLKTLSEGSHTFEIVWTDGAAGTGFTVARNTSGSNNTGSNNTGNNDNNDSTDNSAAAAPTAAATAQELDKVPATGDPFGIWLTLFVISLTGLAGMLARRKKQ